MKLMLSCREARERLTDYAEGALPVRLKMMPLIAYRERHSLSNQNMNIRPRAFMENDGSVKIDPYPEMPALFFQMPRLPATLTGDAYVLLSCLSFTFGTFFMFWGISLLGSFQYSLMCKIEPIFTSIFSVLLLNEVLSAHQYGGIALVLASLLLAAAPAIAQTTPASGLLSLCTKSSDPTPASSFTNPRASSWLASTFSNAEGRGNCMPSW